MYILERSKLQIPRCSDPKVSNPNWETILLSNHDFRYEMDATPRRSARSLDALRQS